MGLLYGENCTILTSTVYDWYTRVTDRRTDGRTDGRNCDSIARLACMLSRAKMCNYVAYYSEYLTARIWFSFPGHAERFNNVFCIGLMLSEMEAGLAEWLVYINRSINGLSQTENC